MTWHKRTSGEYVNGDYIVIREDYPSVGEWDEMDRYVTWYVLTVEQEAGGAALPDALYETTTLRECKAWVHQRLTEGSRA